MEGRAQKCVGRPCELAHKTADKLHKVSTLFGRSASKTTRSGTGGRVARDFLSDCIEILVFWQKKSKTRFTLDSQLQGKISHIVEPTVRFATRPSRKLLSTHIQLQRVWSRSESSTGLQTGIGPRLHFCRKSDGLKVNLWWCCVYIWIAYVCADFMGL